jgi:hypothetical protein
VAKIYNDNKLLETMQLERGLANNHIYGVDFQGNDVWVATSRGVSHGTLAAPGGKGGKSHE